MLAFATCVEWKLTQAQSAQNTAGIQTLLDVCVPMGPRWPQESTNSKQSEKEAQKIVQKGKLHITPLGLLTR